MNFITKYSGVVALVILAIVGGMNYVSKSHALGTTSCSGITCLAGGLRLVTDLGGDFESDVAAVFGSTMTQTSTNTATSTFSGGCVQTTATSTATPIKLVFGNGSGASSAATTTFKTGQVMIGLAGFAYGTCP